MTTVADVVRVLDSRFPVDKAEAWDVNGLTVGEPGAEVTRVLFAVDPTIAVLQEAIDSGADMIVTHHPLLLRGVTTVAADTPKGAMVHELISQGIALYNAHTNADAAVGGVADTLAAVLGIVDTVPLVPDATDPTVGLGRVGRLAEPVSLEDFAVLVAGQLPRTHHGVRVAGVLEQRVERVAVLGGSGDSLFDAVRAADVDAYVTADLRHHPASEARELAELTDGRPALVDVSHFASEWAWLAAAAEHLTSELAVETLVSDINTDPWTARFA